MEGLSKKSYFEEKSDFLDSPEALKYFHFYIQ
jgi:hypothetical protein